MTPSDLCSRARRGRAVEAVARVDAGEHHTGVLLARTALSVAESSASEFGIEVRALASEALQAGAPATARDASLRAPNHPRRPPPRALRNARSSIASSPTLKVMAPRCRP